jgi:hypothetical protein
MNTPDTDKSKPFDAYDENYNQVLGEAIRFSRKFQTTSRNPCSPKCRRSTRDGLRQAQFS